MLLDTIDFGFAESASLGGAKEAGRAAELRCCSALISPDMPVTQQVGHSKVARMAWFRMVQYLFVMLVTVTFHPILGTCWTPERQSYLCFLSASFARLPPKDSRSTGSTQRRIATKNGYLGSTDSFD